VAPQGRSALVLFLNAVQGAIIHRIPMKANVELDVGRRTFASGLLPELIAVLRGSRLGDLVAITGAGESIGSELETWCRFTGNPLVESTVEQGRARWVIRCGAVPVPSESNRPVGSRLWLYTNFDCNLSCDYCCVRSSPIAPRRELGLERVQRMTREAAELGVREIFVTGGEPFLLANIGEILAACAAAAPTTVLTNGMLFTAGGLRVCVRCRVIESSCRSVWTAARPTGTTSTAGQAPGRAHVKASSALARKVFACGWRRPCQPMRKLRTSVNSWMKSRSVRKIG
jgi:hypothetical protein